MDSVLTNQLVLNLGLIGLFIISILADTMFPLSSEAAIVSLWLLGGSVIVSIIIASLGNYLGTVINYLIGKLGNGVLANKYIKKKWYKHAHKLFTKYGPLVLFFSFIPFIGDPLTLVAGLFNFNFRKFTLFVLSGKIFRFIVIYLIISFFD